MTPTADIARFLPYQGRWILDDARVAIAEKSRRVGFTYAEAFRSVERRLTRGTDHYFASRDKESAGEFILYCKKWAQVFNVVAQDMGERLIDERNDVRAFVLRFENDARIVALSSNPDAFRSKGGDVTLDEFAFHRDAAAVFVAAQPVYDIWGHSLRIISTHNGEGSLFNRLIAEVKNGKRPWTIHRVTLRDAVNEGLLSKLGRTDNAQTRDEFVAHVRGECLNQAAYDQEYDCIPGSDDASLLTYDLIQSCEADGLKLCEISELPRTGLLYAGYDVGRSRDLSVLWVWEKVGDVYTTRLMKRFPKMNYTLQEGQLNLLMANPAVRRCCIDKGLIGGMLAERQTDRWGYRAEGLQLGIPMQNELAMPMLRAFEDKRLRIPAEDALRESLHKVRKIVAGNVIRFVAPHDDAGHSDEFWAAALGLHAADDLSTPLPRSSMARPIGF